MAEFRFITRVFDPIEGVYREKDVQSNFMALVLATNDSWGDRPGRCLDLSRARFLSLCIKAKEDFPDLEVQAKAFITRGKPFGDVSSQELATTRFRVGTQWQQIRVPLDNLGITRVITPLVLLVHRPHQHNDVVLYLDDVFYGQ